MVTASLQESSTTPQKTLISKSAVKERFAFSEGAIQRFLGEPDQQAPNPLYRRAAPICFYNEERVIQATQTPEFQEWLLKAAKRRESALKAKATKTAAALEKAESRFKCWFPKMDETGLRKAAIQHYNSFWGYREDKIASLRDDDHFLNRITANYLRHECSNYDTILDWLYGKVGKGEARLAMRGWMREELYRVYG